MLALERGDSGCGLRRVDLDQWRTQARPGRVVPVMGHDSLEEGDHRERLERLAHAEIFGLQRVGVRRLPVVEDVAQCRRADVGGRRDAAGCAVPQAVEQERLPSRGTLRRPG